VGRKSYGVYAVPLASGFIAGEALVAVIAPAVITLNEQYHLGLLPFAVGPN
jgi:uncharacterized oligopeptide transporter (OPT) family protein